MMHGGKKFGEGNFGVTYDACSTDIDTFCKLEAFTTATKITLYMHTNQKVLRGVKKFKDALSNDYVIKVFKSTGSQEAAFKEELANLRQVCKVFGKKRDVLTALPPGNMPLGLSTDTGLYATIARRCTNDLNDTPFTDAKVKKLVNDIMASLKVMQEKRFAHCDLKPENIMYCANEDRFKLIDWGLSRPLTTPANLYTPNEFGCPLGHYMSGMPMMLAMGNIYMYNFVHINEWCRSSIFMEVFGHITDKMKEITQTSSDRSYLFRRYSNRLDEFSLGLVIAYVVWRHDLNWKRQRKVCYELLDMH